MWISTKQTKHKPIDRCSFTAWAAAQSSAVINNSERRKKDENRKKILTGTLLALCTALLVLCSVLAIGWSKAAKTGDALPEVRNNGTAIQWKYSDEADGKNGKDGIDGANGKDGVDGKDGINGTDGINAKSIEVQRAETHIQWRYEGDEWQDLVAIADITGPTGQKGADGANGKTPEFRVSENTLQ